jgi:hypothetical protein
MSKNVEQLPEPDPALKALEVFVGKWNTEGKSKMSLHSPAV